MTTYTAVETVTGWLKQQRQRQTPAPSEGVRVVLGAGTPVK